MPEANPQTAKPKTKTAIPPFPGSVFAGAEAPAAFRDIAEKSLSTAKDNYEKMKSAAEEATTLAGAVYEFEPTEEEILGELLPKNLAVQIYTALLENAASEQGARMTAMDNATRNAGEMINRLTLNYNRTRQAAITKELIEIISGAEAL